MAASGQRVVSVLFISSWGDLTSAPRFGLVIFPIVIALALLGHNKGFKRTYIVVSAVLAAISMVVFSQWGVGCLMAPAPDNKGVTDIGRM